MRKLVLIAVSVLISAVLFMSVSHKKSHLCDFIAPKNKVEIPSNVSTGITEKKFNEIMDKFETIYKPIFSDRGGKLKLNRLWTNKTVNASADQTANGWEINMYGGLARYKGMTADGFTLVLCHEAGHHIGGFPKYESEAWASNEGQSDYFATMKCAHRMLGLDALYWPPSDTPSAVKKSCSLQHKSQDSINLCIRSTNAGMVLAQVLHDLNGEKDTLSFETPDPSQVKKTSDGHPKSQCRLDTYFNGAVCGVSHTDDFSDSSPVPGACAEEKGDKVGTRPNCWYHPQSPLD